MSKLEEIKKSLEIREELGRRDSDTLTIRYLLSLIEEKDKALSFYEDLDNYKDYRGYFSRETAADRDSGNLARKALRGGITMSEKTTSITEAIQSGDKIPPSVYQMWIEDLIRDREILVDGLNWIVDRSTNHLGCTTKAETILNMVGELDD